MNEKNFLNDVEYEKIDTATFIVNGQVYNNSFTKENLANLANDGVITIDIDASTTKNTEKFANNKIREEMNLDDNLRKDLSNIQNLNYKNRKKTIFISIAIICMIIISSLIIL